MSSIPWAVERPGCGVRATVRDGKDLRVCDFSEAATWRFEDGSGVRQPVSYKGQRNWVGMWWFSKSGEFIPYESWVERDHVMVLDRRRDVRAVVAQPLMLELTAGRHTPDFFVRMADGGALLVDVRPDERIGEVDAAKFEQTRQAGALVGWAYERVGVLEAVQGANCRWLSAYRHPWCGVSRVASFTGIVAALGEGRLSLDQIAFEVGAPPLAVMPLVFHHVWRGDLMVDESVPLSPRSLVWKACVA